MNYMLNKLICKIQVKGLVLEDLFLEMRVQCEFTFAMKGKVQWIALNCELKSK